MEPSGGIDERDPLAFDEDLFYIAAVEEGGERPVADQGIDEAGRQLFGVAERPDAVAGVGAPLVAGYQAVHLCPDRLAVPERSSSSSPIRSAARRRRVS